MTDGQAQDTHPDVLLAEILRLRGEVSRLEARIEELDRLAHHDSLVPLPNRRGFIRQLERLIARLNRYGESAALLFVDLNGLKRINDSFGHSAGDAALVHVAELLSSGIRQSDCVARLGGDEFAVLVERTDESFAAEAASRLCERVASESFAHEGVTIPLSIAVGVAAILPGDTPDEVIGRADRAMYQVKAAA